MRSEPKASPGPVEYPGARVKQLRDAAGYSQMALARMSGLSQATIIRAELAGVVTRRTAERLAPVLGIGADELLGEAAPAAPGPPRGRRPR